MTKTFLSILFFGCLFTVQAFAFNDTEFKQQEARTQKIYDTFTAKKETKRLIVEGMISKSTDQLTKLVPDNKKTFYDYYILGNMLFVIDPQASYHYMRMAEKLEPDNPYVQFERGIHEHRQRRYSKAIGYYEKYLASAVGKNDNIASAYLTHAYLMTDQIDKAFSAWQNANFHSRHTAIETAMYTIFSHKNQEADREQLIASINAGDTYKLCDLYYLDSYWESDWWNYSEKKPYLKFDMQLAKSKLAKASTAGYFFTFYRISDQLTDKQYMERLKSLGVLAGKKQLPGSSELIYSILRRLISKKLITPKKFLESFEPQLIKLSSANPHDRKYYDILAFLYVNTNNKEKLKSIDYYGWKTLKVENFATSYVLGIEPNTEKFRTTLHEALIDFPLSVTLTKLDLQIEKKNKKHALARFVAAQFADVKNNWKGPYRLSDYMASLRHELEKLDKSSSKEAGGFK